jgi:hypothetical protein
MCVNQVVKFALYGVMLHAHTNFVTKLSLDVLRCDACIFIIPEYGACIRVGHIFTVYLL